MNKEDPDKKQREALDKAIRELRSTIASNLKRLRGASDKGRPEIAQEALALRAGLDRTLVSKLERGVASPSLETLLKLAQVLDVSVDELLRKG